MLDEDIQLFHLQIGAGSDSQPMHPLGRRRSDTTEFQETCQASDSVGNGRPDRSMIRPIPSSRCDLQELAEADKALIGCGPRPHGATAHHDLPAFALGHVVERGESVRTRPCSSKASNIGCT